MYANAAFVNTILSSAEVDTANYRVTIDNTQINTTVTRNTQNVQKWMIDNKLIVVSDYEDNQEKESKKANNVFGLELKWIPGKKIVLGPRKGHRKCDKMALIVFCTKEACLIYQMLPTSEFGIPISLPLALTTENNIFYGFGIDKKVEKARDSEEISHFGDDSHLLFPNAVDVRQPSHPALSYFPDMRKTSLRRLGRIILKIDIPSINKVTNSFRKRKSTYPESKGGKMIFNIPAIRRRRKEKAREEKAGGRMPESYWGDYHMTVDQVEQLTVSAYLSYKIGITMVGSHP